MNSKHTPGPWRIAPHDTLKDIRHIDAGPQGYERETLAIVQGKRSEANAHLISAAPELLEALERLEAGVRLWMSRGVTDDDMAIARAAIAKAKGEA